LKEEYGECQKAIPTQMMAHIEMSLKYSDEWSSVLQFLDRLPYPKRKYFAAPNLAGELLRSLGGVHRN
jgi:hypothetical protein